MLVDYVDPNIGGIGHLLTATNPTVYLPHAMVGVHPIFAPAMKDRYLADRIQGFPVPTYLHAQHEVPSLMPFRGDMAGDISSQFDHDFETAGPHHYSVLLERSEITSEHSTAGHCVHYRWTFPARDSSVLLRANGAELNIVDDTTVCGTKEYKNITSYFCIRFSRSFASPPTRGDAVRLDFSSLDGGALEARIGVSFLSVEQAQKNLEKEIGSSSFSDTVGKAQQVWENALSKVRVEGGTEKQRRVFYTSLYRYMGRMQCVSEGGRYYSAYDQKVHDDSRDFYVTDQIWDTFRSAHPLRILLDPRREQDMIQSYVRMYEQSGWFPRFPMLESDRPCMIGHHEIAMISDGYRKGLRDFDVDTAYAGMRKSALEATKLPWRFGPLNILDKYHQKEGYMPGLRIGEKEFVEEVHPWENRQSVAVTLECSYDDWCLSKMAEELGQNDDAKLFAQRSQNYRTLYNKETGFMTPRADDGNWVEGFDPKLSGGQGGRDYFAECNSWTYTWSVQHDIAGLMELMGGPRAAEKRLDQLFTEQYDIAKYHFLGQFPDSTGLIGQFVTGNEPSFHIPYLYDYFGAPWKTQRRIRQIMDIWFGDGPLGICGDEDGGAMSSWHVFNAMGFFPVCPGDPRYAIGSPVFEQVTIDNRENGPIVVSAGSASAQNKYIQSATLNGVPLDSAIFDHEAIANGGKLVLKMGPRPNKAWGAKSLTEREILDERG